MGTYVSLHGRAFGFDSETGAIIRNGSEGAAGNETVTVGSTATTIVARGITTLPSSAGTTPTYTLAAPLAAGTHKRLFATGASTAQKVTLASGNFSSTSGTSGTTATFTAIGQSLTLQALSTALYSVVANIGSVAFTTV